MPPFLQPLFPVPSLLSFEYPVRLHDAPLVNGSLSLLGFKCGTTRRNCSVFTNKHMGTVRDRVCASQNVCAGTSS